MNVLLLSAGYGERLKPITLNTPKCLIKVKNKPMLKFWIEKISALNVENIYINTHYLHKEVDNYIKKNNFNVISLYESFLLGTGGTIINNLKRFVNEDLLVIHCDNFTRDNLKNFVKAHINRPKNCKISLYSFITDKPENCGILEIKNQLVTCIYEKQKLSKGNIANGAIYIFSKQAISEIKNEIFNAKDIVLDILPFFYNKIYAYRSNQDLIDIGTHENLNKANQF